MQKTKHLTCFYHTVVFFSTSCQIKFNSLSDYENYSADIDYKDFVKIYRECTKEPYYFLTIDTTLPASDLIRFRKNLFYSYKNGSSSSN